MLFSLGMTVELLILGIMGGGFLSGASVGGYYVRKLRKQLKKQGYQLNTIEQLYNEVQKASNEADSRYIQTIEALVRALEARDMYTKGHSDRVNKYSMIIGRNIGLSEEELEDLHHGSLLHDIGKIGVYDRILLKPQGLTEDEFQMMQSHPELGQQILAGIHSMQHHIGIILHHHERQDGSGYPLGLKGDEIPMGARIVQVADTWDAMTSDRPYRRRLSKEHAIKQLREASGTQLDSHCVEAFLDHISPGRTETKLSSDPSRKNQSSNTRHHQGTQPF